MNKRTLTATTLFVFALGGQSAHAYSAGSLAPSTLAVVVQVLLALFVAYSCYKLAFSSYHTPMLGETLNKNPAQRFVVDFSFVFSVGVVGILLALSDKVPSLGALADFSIGAVPFGIVLMVLVAFGVARLLGQKVAQSVSLAN